MDMNKVYISSPQYSHGQLQSIDTIEALGENIELLETLTALGLESYSSVNVEELKGLCLRAVRSLFSEGNFAATDIEAIVYPSTCYFMGSMQNNPDLPLSLVESVVEEFELKQAIPYGVSFSRCVNTINAIDLARAMIRESRYSAVMVLIADSMQDKFSRIVDPGISVVSDVASCVVVSSKPLGKNCYEINQVRNYVDWSLAKINAELNFPEFLKRTAGGMKCLAEKLYQCNPESDASDYEQLITNTVNNSVVRIFSHATGFPADKIYHSNVSRLGHCDGSDVIINLKDYSDNHSPSQHLMVIANGPYMWGGMTLTRVINSG